MIANVTLSKLEPQKQVNSYRKLGKEVWVSQREEDWCNSLKSSSGTTDCLPLPNRKLNLSSLQRLSQMDGLFYGEAYPIKEYTYRHQQMEDSLRELSHRQQSSSRCCTYQHLQQAFLVPYS